MPLARALAVAAFALAAAGCGERPEPVGGELAAYPVTVRGQAERPLVVRERPDEIAALTPGAAEIVAALGAASRLVGVPAGLEDTSETAAAAHVVRPSGLVDVERVAALGPDLVIASRETDPADLRTVRRETAATVYVQPESSIRDVVRAVLELGFVIGEPVEARRVAVAVRREIARTERRVAGLDRVRVFVDTGFLLTVAPDSLLGDLVRRAGGDLVGDASAPLRDACDVAALDPDVVLRVLEEDEPAGGPSFARCPRRGRTPRLSAVRADLVTHAGPRVGQALAEVATALHPDATG